MDMKKYKSLVMTVQICEQNVSVSLSVTDKKNSAGEYIKSRVHTYFLIES